MSTMTPDRVSVRMIGVARPSMADFATALDAYHADLGDGADTGWLPPRRLEPVFADAAGTPMLVRPAVDRPVAVPYPTQLPAPTDRWADSTFTPAGPPADRPDPSGLFDDVKGAVREWAAGAPRQIAQSVMKDTLMNLIAGGGLGNILGSVQGSVLGTLGGLGPAAGAIGGLLRGLTGTAASVPGALGIVSGGCLGGPAGSSLAGLSPSAALSAIGDQLMSAWQVEDSDSMGEQLAHHFANKWKDKLKDPGAALDQIQGYFTGTSAPATCAAVRVGDVDVAGNPVTAGSPDVLVEGQPLARVGDAVVASGVQVYMGGATVLTNGLMTARVTSASQAGPFADGAGTVFVNGPGGGAAPPPKQPPATPTSDSTTAPPSSAAAGSGSKAAADAPSAPTEAQPTGPTAGTGSGSAEPSSAAASPAATEETRLDTDGKRIGGRLRTLEEEQAEGVFGVDDLSCNDKEFAYRDSPDDYACVWMHCSNECVLARYLPGGGGGTIGRNAGGMLALMGGDLMEMAQSGACLTGYDSNLCRSAFQGIDFRANMSGILIAMDPSNDGMSCEMACDRKWGHTTSQQPEGFSDPANPPVKPPHPYGPFYPDPNAPPPNTHYPAKFRDENNVPGETTYSKPHINNSDPNGPGAVRH
ncbi:MAG TPA: PAAR domain-containing protein [Gemmataceae bacterium]|nr:PAAR domain-containing protein [Gemmataceae bacterium]